MKTLSVVVPVYFNEGSLLPLFRELQEVEKRLLDLGVGLELIFVDDGSGDRSYDRLVDVQREAPTRARVIKLTRNFGQVPAILAGLRHALDAAGLARVEGLGLAEQTGVTLTLTERGRYLGGAVTAALLA